MSKNQQAIIEWAVADIARSPFQRRTHFSEDAMAELAESVKHHGVIQPLIVRVVDPDGKQAELVAGERRWRASKAAGLATAPVIVRNLSDQAAAEIVLIENLQREDLLPMEEAQSYADLKEMRNADGTALYTDESLAERLGKKLWHIRQRLRLLRIPKSLSEAVDAGTISVSTASLVGQIHSVQRREDAARDILEPHHQEIPLNYEQTKTLIREKYLVKVSKASGFDPEDATLVPVATGEDGARLHGGACGDCPFRSGNDPGIQDELSLTVATKGKKNAGGSTKGIDANLCINPACHDMKLAANWSRVRVQAQEKGQPTLSQEEAAKIFTGYHGELPYDSKYADVNSAPDWKDIGEYSDQKWKTHLAGVEGVPRILAQHPRTGRIVELVDRKAASQGIKRKNGASKGASENQEKEKRKEERDEQKLALETGRVAMDALTEAVLKEGAKSPKVARLLFDLALDESGNEGAWWLAKWLEVPPPHKGAMGRDYGDGIRSHVEHKAGDDPDVWLCFTAAALLAQGVKWSGPASGAFQDACQRFDVDLRAARDKAKARLGSAAGKGKKKETAAKKSGAEGDASGRSPGAEGEDSGPGTDALSDVERANAAYEARVAENGPGSVTISGIEAEFGLRKNRLKNWRLNHLSRTSRSA